MTFPPADLYQQQIIKIPKILKDLLACRIVLAPSHQNPENIRRLFRQQSCLNRKSSMSWKYSKAFSPAELSQQQTINIPEIFQNFFACRIVLAANHQFSEIFKDFFACRVVLAENRQYPGSTQRFFCLQNSLSRKSSISPKNSKILYPADFSQPQTISIPKYSKSFSPADLSQPQIISILKIFKDFFACRIV